MMAETPDIPTLEQFLFPFAHDLRHALRRIVVQAQLGMRALGQDESTARSHLETIIEAAKEQENLISAAVMFADAGSVATDEYSRARNLAQGALLSLKDLMNSSSAEIDISGISQLEVPNVCKSILEELFRNALRFHRPGEPPVVKVTCRELEDAVELMVADNGIGIDREYRQLVFQPFARLQGKDQFPGFGLGLSICQRLALLCKGRIEIVEQPPPGVTVRLTFPSKLRLKSLRTLAQE